MGMLKTWMFHTFFNFLNFITHGNLPPLVAVAAVIERDGSMLFINRSDGLGLSFPGGIMKWEESIEETLQREVKEETGFAVAITRLIGIYSAPYRDPRLSAVQIAYAATIVDGQPQSSPEGGIHWVRKESLPTTLAFDHAIVIADYLNERVKVF